MKILHRENISCWYELSFQKTKPAIKLRVHKDFIENTKPIRNDAPIVVSLKEEFGFENFVGSFDGNFGFDNAFVRKEETDEFVEFVTAIPEIKKNTGKVCSHCNGSGKEDWGPKCLWCSGKGKEYAYDWKAAYTISANFTIFPSSSHFPEKETSSSLLQLMTISTITEKGPHGGSIDGEFSIPLCNWIDSLRESNKPTISEMIEAMQLSYKVMFGLTGFQKYYFRASVDYEGGWLNTSCPGNACGLNPVHMGPKKGRGYEFSSHNVDTPAQQIELIASLAALHDKAREEINI